MKEILKKELTKYLTNKFGILNGSTYSPSGIFQNYLVFIPAKKYIKYFSGTTWIDLWKSNGLSEENIEKITKLLNNFASLFGDNHALSDIDINRYCLIYNNIFIPKNVINLYISYILNP